MTNSCLHWIKNIKLAFCLALLETIVISPIKTTFAQSKIIPDNTLSTESSKVINNSSGLPIENIDGGAQRGINLFHSFREFNVGEGRAVYFTNPVGIENIISRVTGSSPSEIFGKLGVLGNANLFLINPNGIIFGKNASLDVNGSFVATSANAIRFGNQGFFSASSPQTPSLLTIKPSALFFNQIGAGKIENRSMAPAGVDGANNPVLGLRVPDGESLLLVGGNVLNAGGLNAFGGRIELGGLASPGEIGLNLNNQNLTFPNQVARGDVSLTNGAVVNVAGNSGGAMGYAPPGAIALYGKNIDISGGSSVLAGIAAGLGIPKKTAGDITLNATQAISISQSSRVTNQVGQNAMGNSGNINIQADSLNLTDGSQLSSRIFGRGNSGNISVDVRGAITLDSEDSNSLTSRIVNQVQPSGVGNGGDINIKANSLTLTKGGALAANTLGRGNSGNISVDVSGAIKLEGENSNGLVLNSILNQVLSSGIGDSGDINIKADSLTITPGGYVSATTFGQGNGGNIFVDVRGAIIVDGISKNGYNSSISSLVASSAVGNGGDINIKADSLSMTHGTPISTEVFGRGNGGNISIDVRGAVTLDSLDSSALSGISSAIRPSGIGNAGDINLKADSLTIKPGGVLFSSTFGTGNSGNIFVDVRGAITLNGGKRDEFTTFIGSQATPGAIGNGGDININAESLTVTQDAFISTDTFGQGNGGNIKINLTTPTSNLTLSDGASIAASTLGEGKGGNIQIESNGSVNLTNDSSITVNSLDQGNAGNLRITTGSLTIQDKSDLLADTVSSEGGNIQLQVRDILLLRKNSSISTTAGQSQRLEDTVSNQGVKLKVRDILLRDNSSISTTIENAGGSGGNIDINTKFLVAVPSENSDIIANAFAGKGGLIKITAQGIFGIEQRQNLTPLSDITAFSQENPRLDGEVVINIQNADIRKQLVPLPTNVVDVSKLISQRCSTGRVSTNQTESQFIVTGRGGLPPQPGGALRVAAIAVDENAIASEKQNQSPEITPTLEANSWRFDRQGRVVLTASATSEASSFATNPGICHAN
ncbi:filamentous hemagglutinin N-terminal domain-containing protein [Nostoc sp. KVJ3]|uniref:two-partner secretion domain-containing protein n=1 Tax=Nostoc sp. KVJ3 TaxID=457945 RepID=UPI0022380F1B|nr:filamentous hemagglutinin N-terminal domain-containing protein [Nostoc sp. KVJ3]MCW5315512.1 filamentous hemagglutinin N-terminal domain-containing protein [Nostoc sp. KVJ3]